MTGQEADSDEGLDFDCFLVTGFKEGPAPKIACRASSNFNGLNERGLERSGVVRFFFMGNDGHQ